MFAKSVWPPTLIVLVSCSAGPAWPLCRCVKIANDAHQWTYGIARGCPPKAAGVSRSGQRSRRDRPRKGQCGGLENAPGAAAQRGRGARGGLDGHGLSAWYMVEEPEEVCVPYVTPGRLDGRRLSPRQSAAPRLQNLVLEVNPSTPQRGPPPLNVVRQPRAVGAGTTTAAHLSGGQLL